MDRRTRWMRWGAVGAAAVVALAGCGGGDEPEPSASPAQTDPEPTLSNDEFATNAADTAIEFVALTDRAFADLEVPPELYELTTDEIAANIAADVDEYLQQGYRLEGSSALINITPLSVQPSAEDSAVVSLEACLDTSGSQVVDGSGQPISGGGSERRPVTFEVRWQNDMGRVVATAFPGTSGDPECV
ncbi:hypothetical protein [Agrococcus sp. SGAir0287]|uniref:hypothetical protein n=1 Tax=Agrococcus sp. SGAir0287 TaxID=2070347 RepID=UPI001C303D6B|nr:hypothetical protein [Agrococcus sp. SGAir0287]